MRRSLSAAIAIAVVIGAVVNYFVIQAILAMPCEGPESCNQRVVGVFIVAASDIFAIIIVVLELVKEDR